MNTKKGFELQIGDEIKTWFNGGSALIKYFYPYVGNLLSELGEKTRIAHFAGCGVEMTIPENMEFEVISD